MSILLQTGSIQIINIVKTYHKMIFKVVQTPLKCLENIKFRRCMNS